MSKKYNDDADGKITFRFTPDAASVSFKSKMKVIVVLFIILLIIISFTIVIIINAKNNNKSYKSNDDNISIIQNTINTSLKTEILISESTKTEAISTISATMENEISNDIVEIIPVKTINDFSESILTISSNTQLSDENIGNEINNYSALNIIDNDYSTCWCEGSSDYGIGDYIEIQFDDVYLISEISIWNGLCKNEDLFYKNSRLSKISLTFSNGEESIFELTDGWENRHNLIKFPSIETTYIKITIDDVFAGNKYQDTCISEIYVS